MARARIFSTLVLLGVAACSASKGSSITEAGPASTTDGGTTDAASRPDSSTTTTEPPTTDASAGDSSAGECSSSATQTACVTCCSNAHQDGAGAYLVATIDCMCLPANCATECATTLCNADNPKGPDAKCTTCVNGKNAACAPAIKTACTADPECIAFDGCIGGSSCTSKPN